MHLPSYEQISMLPCCYSVTISMDMLDLMGHLNVRWYMAFYDSAAWSFFRSIGMTEAYYHEFQMGGFALQHFIRYFSEVREGEEIRIRLRLLALGRKRIHMMYFMLNETRRALASTMEALTTFADLRTRRSAAFPPEKAEAMAALLKYHSALDWTAPVSGAEFRV
ncbi:hypothetical protein BVG81_008665 [Haliangium sp. UPWRP_2]|nr:hypothetical protein BVG81_008665 [Haliangium sp. UPWRP_2]